MLLLETGEVYGFGCNSSGQLGMGSLPVVSTPTKIENIDAPADLIACGATHTVVLADNQVSCCALGWIRKSSLIQGVGNQVTETFNFLKIIWVDFDLVRSTNRCHVLSNTCVVIDYETTYFVRELFILSCFRYSPVASTWTVNLGGVLLTFLKILVGVIVL